MQFCISISVQKPKYRMCKLYKSGDKIYKKVAWKKVEDSHKLVHFNKLSEMATFWKL